MAFHPGKPDKQSPTVAFRRALTGLGLDPDKDVYWVYALRCNPYKKANSVKPADVKACNHNLNLELSNISAPIIIAAGPVAVQSVLSTKGGVTGNRLGWHNVTVGDRPRLLMVTLSPNQLDRNSLYVATETTVTDKKGNETITVERDKRMLPFGSAPWFFKNDMLKLREKLVELNLL